MMADFSGKEILSVCSLGKKVQMDLFYVTKLLFVKKPQSGLAFRCVVSWWGRGHSDRGGALEIFC